MIAPDFAAALQRAASPVIAEVKPFSPEHGNLIGTLSVAEIARAYAHAGAACLSVTTGKWHGGRPEMVAELAATGLPVLRKDFIVSRSHLVQSRDLGAAAVLLTRTLLRASDVTRLADAALEMGLTPFIEVASAQELDGLALPAQAILAINNRNIREQEVDGGGVGRSLYLRALARARHEGLLVSASGILTPEDANEVLSAGFDGVLIGTALMAGGQEIERETRAFLAAVTRGAPQPVARKTISQPIGAQSPTAPL